ncbi:AfsR/SARP family transcriptional regulator [Actinosynnema sp. CS-041913]|uniref:AfsR/SARP family transcriptional regulator n=1 Tax=Actinosynnema sp. CS-041913 TaxID=3239917 RepID=UPI003D926730
MSVELQLLGEVVARVDGRVVDLGPARQRCVLVALAVDAPRLVPADRLVERVWGVNTPRRGRETLYSYISRLRQALSGADVLEVVSRSGGYALLVDQPTLVVDLHRFHDLRARAREQTDDARAARLLTEALRLWRGPALTGVDGQWAEAARDGLERERLAALHDLADVRLRLGQGGDLVAELAMRANEHPLDERIGGQYLLALHQAGRTADALDHYRHLRDRLVDELGTDPGTDLQGLHRRILTADPALTTTTAGADRPPATPLQLPAAPGVFTGRGSELAELDRILGDAVQDGDSGADFRAAQGAVSGNSPSAGATAVISAIGGTGGIGKTWLALAWANRWSERFPDGQLFVDLRGFSPAGEPMAPDDAVRGFLDALGVAPDRMPADPNARAARYRSLVADRRMLIVLDNAASADQVVPLLPGSATCTVLVTSRNRLTGLVARHGAHPLHLDVLTDVESRQLLVARLGEARVAAEEPAVAELIALCGGFPLALGVVAARAAAEPRLPLADTVGELREFGLDALNDTDPTANPSTVLSWSLRGLSDRQRRVFALLGIAPGPDIDLHAATSLTGLSPRNTRTVLRGLADASLIIHTPGGRYLMHDLVRDYATVIAHENLAEPVRQAALERVEDSYRYTAHTAAHHLEPHRPPIRLDPPVPGTHPRPLPDYQDALTWLDSHHPHLLAAQHTAATHRRHHVVWHLAWTLHTYHLRRGHRHDELAVWQAAADAADHLPDPTTHTYTHRLLGRAHAALGRHEQAIGHLNQALVLAEHHNDPTQQALTHFTFTWAWEQRGDYRRALDHARHALDLFRTLNLPVWEAEAFNALGWCAARLGEYDTARDHCQASLALHHRLHDPDGRAGSLDSLGFIEHHTGHHRQAIDHYQQAITLGRTLGDTTRVATTLDRLGHPHTALGRHDQARTAWQEALELYRQHGREADAERVQRQLDDLDTTIDIDPHDTG